MKSNQLIPIILEWGKKVRLKGRINSLNTSVVTNFVFASATTRIVFIKKARPKGKFNLINFFLFWFLRLSPFKSIFNISGKTKK